MATRRTIQISAVDVEIFNQVADRQSFCTTLGEQIASALMAGITVKEVAVLAMHNVDIVEIEVKRANEGNDGNSE